MLNSFNLGTVKYHHLCNCPPLPYFSYLKDSVLCKCPPRTMKIAIIICTCAINKMATTMLQYKIFPIFEASKQLSRTLCLKKCQKVRDISRGACPTTVPFTFLTQTAWSSCSLSSSQHSCRDCLIYGILTVMYT